MSLCYLRTTEQCTQATTRRELHGIHQHVPQVLDSLFKLAHFYGAIEPPETDRGAVQSFVWDGYITAPYTAATLYSLYETGNYLEASILLRHLLELLLQMRFLSKHPEKARRHLIGEKRVSFKKMLEELSSGSGDFYERHYGNLLCGFAHGGFVKSAFRVKRTSAKDGVVVMGNQYDQKSACYVGNQLVAMLFGFLRGFEEFFPKNRLSDDGEVRRSVDESKSWLVTCMEAHKKKDPRSHEWYRHMDRIIW